MRHPDLSPRQRKALNSLLLTPTVAAAAKHCGMGRATLNRYLRDPAFADAYREERRAMVDQSVAAIQKISISAVTVLHDSLADGNDLALRVRTAKIVLDLLLKGTEFNDWEERLRELEERANGAAV